MVIKHCSYTVTCDPQREMTDGIKKFPGGTRPELASGMCSSLEEKRSKKKMCQKARVRKEGRETVLNKSYRFENFV